MKMTCVARLLNRTLVLSLALLIAASFSLDSSAQNLKDWTGNANFLLGFKDLDEDDWRSLDTHRELGFDIDLKKKTWPVSINFGYLRSKDDDTVTILGSDWDAEGITSELYVGAKKIFDASPLVHPFINAGLSYTNAEVSYEIGNLISNSMDDSALGAWLGGGVYFTLKDHLNVGLNFRYSKAEVSFRGSDREAGGFHYGLMVGYHF